MIDAEGGIEASLQYPAYRTTIYSPQMNSQKIGDINSRPEMMWEILRGEGNILKEIGAKDRVSWEAVFPAGQYVNGNEGSVHFMITPKLSTYFGSPETLSYNQITPASKFALEFIKDDKTFVVYNMGPEKNSPQSWWNWHMHCIRFEDKLEGLDYTPKVLKEPWYEDTEEILYSEFKDILKEPVFEKLHKGRCINPERLNEFGFKVRGGVVMEFDDLDPKDLAVIFQEVHMLYGEIHQKWLDVFFNGSIDNVKEVPLDLEERINEHFEDKSPEVLGKIRDFARKILPSIIKRVQGEGREIKNMYKGPTYSVGIFERGGRIYLLLKPHFFRKGGGMEGLGIQIKRVYEDREDLKEGLAKKRERSLEYVEDIMQRVQRGEIKKGSFPVAA